MGVPQAMADISRTEPIVDIRMQLRIEMLGHFRVKVGFRTVESSTWKLHKAVQLVQLLALAPHHRLHREQVLDLLWPDFPPSSAANNLRVTLHAARHALDPDQDFKDQFLQYANHHLHLLRNGSIWIDVLAFESAADSALTSLEVAEIEAALDLYTGHLLVDPLTHPWGIQRRDATLNTYLTLLLKLAGIREHRGELSRAIAVLKFVLMSEPSNEEAHASLMRLYTQTGHRTWALRQFHHLKRILRAELDIEPSEEAQLLYEAIMTGQPHKAH